MGFQYISNLPSPEEIKKNNFQFRQQQKYSKQNETRQSKAYLPGKATNSLLSLVPAPPTMKSLFLIM